eukprot:346513-Alexandrium_andersonii.AAC.1
MSSPFPFNPFRCVCHLALLNALLIGFGRYSALVLTVWPACPPPPPDARRPPSWHPNFDGSSNFVLGFPGPASGAKCVQIHGQHRQHWHSHIEHDATHTEIQFAVPDWSRQEEEEA